MNVTPFGAKSPTETVVGVSADANGNINTKKVWNNDAELIYEMQTTPTGTSTIWTTPVDISDCGAVSLRVSNGMDVACDIRIGTDVKTDAASNYHYNLRHPDGSTNSITVPASTYYMAITPDDEPFLKWINRLGIALVPASTPTTGVVRIWLVRKR